MLSRLSISNVALIEKLDIDFYDGFSVLTGETGAGKSIIIEALNFVLGERASRDLIMSGAQKASVEGRFRLRDKEPVMLILKENELAPEDDELILYREFSESGKSVCRVNGTLVSTGVLKQIGDLLVDIHGQHEHQSLLNPKLHLQMLDSFGGTELTELRARVGDAYRTASAAGRQLHAADMDERERERRCDLLNYQINEIDKAKLKPGEEDDLLEQRKVQQNAQVIMESLDAGTEAISGEAGVLTLLSGAVRQLEAITDFHQEYADVHDRLQEAYYAIEDAGYTLRDQRDSFSFEPDTLDQIEWRLEEISAMKRKYGASIEDVLTYRDKISEEYELLITNVERQDALLRAYEQARDAYLSLAEELSMLRRRTADILRERVLPELADLGMPHAAFEVHFDRLEGEVPSTAGIDGAEFLLSTNLGEPVKPLARVASGGEISRIMLAFKSVLANNDGIPTMVFDEIDSGISGQIGTAVAIKMRQIASEHQVLCITHLPQIAAYAQKQYLVQKQMQQTRTYSTARLLSEDERCGEIARIMGSAQDDAVALLHARSLIDAARTQMNSTGKRE